jgi:hypothetical protein
MGIEAKPGGEAEAIEYDWLYATSAFSPWRGHSLISPIYPIDALSERGMAFFVVGCCFSDQIAGMAGWKSYPTL